MGTTPARTVPLPTLLDIMNGIIATQTLLQELQQMFQQLQLQWQEWQQWQQWDGRW